MLLTRTFSEESYRRALEDWAWLPLAGKRPILASLFGDVFFEDGAGIWMLDVLEGALNHVFPDPEHMAAVLDTEEGQDAYLLAGLALKAERHLGLVPGPGQVLAWMVPPALGGATASENLQLMDFEVYLSIEGQIRRQIKDLPPGTKIAGFPSRDSCHNSAHAGPVLRARTMLHVQGRSRAATAHDSCPC